MRRIIVDYKKLSPEVLKLLIEKFPDGYADDDIIIFDNHHNETIEAVEVEAADAIYLVKVSCKLHYTMTNFDIDDFQVNELGNVIVNVDFPIIEEPDILYDEEE